MIRILVVEDDRLTAEMLTLHLSHQGYEVDHALNAPAALVLMRVQSYDMILLDFLLPGMDGLEFLHQLRRHPAWQRIPVLLVTAAPDADCQNLFQRCGPYPPVRVLRKPFEPEILLSVLEELLPTS